MKCFVKRYASEAKTVRLMRVDIADFAHTCGFSGDAVGEISQVREVTVAL